MDLANIHSTPHSLNARQTTAFVENFNPNQQDPIPQQHQKYQQPLGDLKVLDTTASHVQASSCLIPSDSFDFVAEGDTDTQDANASPATPFSTPGTMDHPSEVLSPSLPPSSPSTKAAIDPVSSPSFTLQPVTPPSTHPSLRQEASHGATVARSDCSVMSEAGTLVSRSVHRSPSSTVVPRPLSHATTAYEPTVPQTSFDPLQLRAFFRQLNEYVEEIETLNDQILEAMACYDEHRLGLNLTRMSPLSSATMNKEHKRKEKQGSRDLVEQRRATAQAITDLIIHSWPSLYREIAIAADGTSPEHHTIVQTPLQSKAQQQLLHSSNLNKRRRKAVAMLKNVIVSYWSVQNHFQERAQLVLDILQDPLELENYERVRTLRSCHLNNLLSSNVSLTEATLLEEKFRTDQDRITVITEPLHGIWLGTILLLGDEEAVESKADWSSSDESDTHESLGQKLMRISRNKREAFKNLIRGRANNQQRGLLERSTELRYTDTHLDTIFALSTHPGKAGIAIIRISGPQAKTVLKCMTQASSSFPKPRYATMRRLQCPLTQELLDKGMVLWFPGPKSFTGEDSVELHCHGGKAVVDGILRGIGSVGSHIRLAEPGEFARRAFENNKLDLTEVEGLADLLNAETEAQRRLALRQADGGLKNLYESWRTQLIGSMALIEALIDFGEDEGIEDDVYDNAKRQAAIVSSIPGTTRDIVEVSLNIGGYPILIGDTAGLRSSQDEIEMEGVRRAQDRIGLADINIAILPVTDFISRDGTRGTGVDPIVLDAIRKNEKTMVLINKMDLSGSNTEKIMDDIRLQLWPKSREAEKKASKHRLWAISCQTGDGITTFLQDFIKILKDRFESSLMSSTSITQYRHRKHLENCLQSLDAFLRPNDIVLGAEELRHAASDLGRITGRVDVEEVLDVVFSEFCIANGGPVIDLIRARSGRMWSDPVPTTHRVDLAHLRPFVPSIYPNGISTERPVAPIAAAVCRDVPLQPLSSALISHYQNESPNISRHNNNIIHSIHDIDLYEDDHHEYDDYVAQPAPRMMKQASKLLTLDDYNLISLGYKPVAVTASIAFYFSAMLGQLLQSIHKTTLTSATLVMFHLGVLLSWQVLSLLPVRGIGYLSTFSGILILGLAVALISVMLLLAGIDPSMGHVPFTVFLNYSGSSSTVYAALSSTLMASFVFCPQDSTIRMAEESRRPERSMPRLIIGATVTSVLLGFPLVIALNYSVIKPIKGLLDETIPAVRAILETLGYSTGTVFMAIVLVAVFSNGCIRLSMAIRTVYAFSRDGGMPRSTYWNHLHPRRETPQRVSWLVTAACMCSVFPYFWGNTVAFNWIASLGCISANLCFVVPLWMRLTHEGRLHFIPGPFSLGRFSKILHIISIAWLLLLSLILMFPSSMPLNKNNFNYASVALVALVIIFAVSWIKARTDFTGGAKGVSRASHRLPARPLQEVNSRKSMEQIDLDLYPRTPGPFCQPPTPAVVQRLKLPAMEKTQQRQLITPAVLAPKARDALFKKPAKQRRLKRFPISPTPPKRDPIRKQQPHRLKPNMSPELNWGNHQQCGQASNITMTTATSNQSYRSSILGIPFSESPEMIPQGLIESSRFRSPSPPPPSPVSPQDGPSSSGSSGNRSTTKPSALLLTRPFVIREGAVPEISIVPPTTIYTNKSASQSSFSASRRTSIVRETKGKSSMHLHGYSSIDEGSSVVIQNAIGVTQLNVTGSRSAPITFYTSFQDTTDRPLNATDSTSSSALGLNCTLAAGRNRRIDQEGSKGVPIRSSKDRVPTPYPSSLADADDSARSEYAVSMMDDPYPFPTTPLTLSPPFQHTVGKRTYCDRGESSIEETVNATEMATPRQAIFQSFDKDRHPPANPTSTFPAHSSGMMKVGDGGARLSEDLSLPMMLPLIRTPTIQQSNHGYDFSFKLDCHDDEQKYRDGARWIPSWMEESLGQTVDSSDEEYNLHYPVVPTSKHRLYTLDISSSPTFQLSPSLFQLPNHDISISLEASVAPLTPSTVRTPPYSGTVGERQDPIEHILRANRDHEEYSGPTQEHFQRTRTVASWAQEQAQIQEKRSRHRTRTLVLKELRKRNPNATLSELSDLSAFSDFSTCSLSSISSTWPLSATQSPPPSQSQSSVASGKKLMERYLKSWKPSQGGDVGLQSLQEDRSLKLSRLELAIREENEKDEEPGLYMDTDDVLTSSLEIESLGAGVGRS
ncbi:tRNA modification GTPase gtpbp3, mitochondrial [Haplosporangium sp. Z 11]|nr:tRNA modification GTPase gtpbp3, mitochondrial [Haplosporangium sp. Z 11]